LNFFFLFLSRFLISSLFSVHLLHFSLPFTSFLSSSTPRSGSRKRKEKEKGKEKKAKGRSKRKEMFFFAGGVEQQVKQVLKYGVGRCIVC
jgi:hypothetical protein